MSVTLDNTLGVLLVAALLSMALWGVTCTQTYDYFMSNADRRLQRWIVALLWIIDTFGSVMHAHIAYYYLITKYGNPTSLAISTWSLNALSILTGVPNFIIRTMFARRIYKFGNRNIIIPAWIMSLSTAEFAIAIVISVKGFLGINSGERFKLATLLYTSVSLSVAADLSVTVALCWLLQSAKTGFSKTDSIVNVLMAYVVNTGLLVTMVSAVGLITNLAMQDNLIYVAFFILGPKLYLNAYLATLNAREKLRGMGSGSSSIPLSRLGVSSSQGRGQGVVLTSDTEKTGSSLQLPTSTMSISLQQTVERIADDSDDGKYSHVV